MSTEIYDILGVGFGPSNIALAVSLRERGFEGKVLFLERNASNGWQTEMMLEGSDIQHNPLRDLITPANPQSSYGFLSYLKAHDRLFDFMNMPAAYPYRSDYAGYVRWVADQFEDQVLHGRSVTSITVQGELYIVDLDDGTTLRARSLVMGTGRTPYMPEPFDQIKSDRVFHLTRYLSRTEELAARQPLQRVAVVGSSQSAVELLLDLRTRAPGAVVDSVCRSFGFQSKDTSPFTHHVYFPEFVDQFFDAKQPQRDRLWSELRRTNYSAADQDVLDQLYMAMYEDKVLDRTRTVLRANSLCKGVQELDDAVVLETENLLDGTRSQSRYDAVILATGFRNLGVGEMAHSCPPLLQGVRGLIAHNEFDVVDVQRDYSCIAKSPSDPLPPLYLNGLCESTHGFGDAGSFSLLSVRAATISQSISEALVATDRLAAQ